MTKLAIIAAASLSLFAAAPAAAHDVTVFYGDLDLATAAGAQTLANRVEAGAETACARPDNRDLKSMAEFTACKDAAIAAALQQLAEKGTALALLD